MNGSISARGGAAGGDGGFAEVSSQGALDFTGVADLRAAGGRAGTLLLDPQDIVIFHAGGKETEDHIAMRNVEGGTDFTYTGTTSFIGDAKINSQLAYGNLTLT